MYLLPPTQYFKPFPNVPVAEPLETFCLQLSLFAGGDQRFITPERIGQAFRHRFHAPAPLPVSWVHERLSEFGIAWEGIPALPDGLKALTVCDETAGLYTIHIPYNAPEEAVTLLHELFEIIYGRFSHHFPRWATRWLEMQNVSQPHQLADKFAYAVVISRTEYQDAAKRTGCDLWELASRFGLRPSNALLALNNYVPTPCPVFISRLNFRNVEQPVQTMMFFGIEGKQGVVWKRNLKSGSGKQRRTWHAVETLGKCFPSQDEIIIADGFAYQALKEGRQTQATTREILGLTLPAPVYAVARPNGIARSQMFLYAVPVEYEDILKDDQIRLREEAAQQAVALLEDTVGELAAV